MAYRKVRVFIGYSYEDKGYLEELHSHLAYHVRTGEIDFWDDTKIEPGEDWREEVSRALQTAEAAILLVSADFLASDFLATQIVSPLLAAAKRGQIKIFSVILRACAFMETELARFYAVNDPRTPLSEMSKGKREVLWTNVANLVRSSPLEKSKQPPPVSAALATRSRETDVSWHEVSTVVVHNEEYMLYQDSVRETWTSDRGAVWRYAKAQHLETGQKVWLKQVHSIHPSQEGEKLREFLKKEHRLLVELEHESDFPHAFLRPYLQEQEYTIAHTARDGKTFASLFAQPGRLPDRYLLHTLLKSLLPLCHALNILHQKQCSHRLLSPETILVVHGRRAVLQDLGLATWSPQVGEGKDAYQAPEQRYLVAQSILPGPLTDIYRLGAILYVTLTGQSVSTASSEIKPSFYNEALSPALDEAILRAVAARPKDRWQTVNEFCAALKSALHSLSFSDKEQ